MDESKNQGIEKTVEKEASREVIQCEESQAKMISAEGGEEAPFELDFQYEDPTKQLEKEWQERIGLDLDGLCGALETIIFMSDRPVSLQKLRDIIDPLIPLRVLHESVARLQKRYEESMHGLCLQEVAEGYQFRTKASYSRFIQDYFKVNTLVLSPTALEVLALVAYRQPISRVEMDKIRGVDSSHILRGLMDRRLVKVVGRSEEMGRPVLYGTTAEFLEVFNLKDIHELPPEYELESLLDKNELGKISDIKSLVHNDDKSRFFFDELEEIDQLQQQIKEISPETEFIQVLKEHKTSPQAEGEQRSAFDLLEEYLQRQQIREQNQLATESELLTSIVEHRIISDLSAGPFNLPQGEDELDHLEQEDGELYEERQLDQEIDDAFEALLEGPPSELEDIDEDEFFASEQEELKAKEAQLDQQNQKFQSLVENIDLEDFDPAQSVGPGQEDSDMV